jgi:hypothetical protein
MPKHAKASSKSHPTSSPAAKRKPAPAPQSRAAEWEEAVRTGDRAKIEALGRRNPDDPNDVPEKDAYVRIENYVEGAEIKGLAAAGKPKLTVWWSEEQLGGWFALGARTNAYFAAEAARRGYPFTEDERVAYIESLPPPADSPMKEISNNMAKKLAALCCGEAVQKTGRPPNRGNG